MKNIMLVMLMAFVLAIPTVAAPVEADIGTGNPSISTPDLDRGGKQG